MDILMSIAGKIAEYVVEPIGRQVGYLLFYKDNFKDLKEAVEELEGARDSINHLVESETRNSKEIEAVVQNWLHSVDDITEEAKKLREDPQRAKAGCSKWSFPDLKSRHQLSRKAKKMVKLVADIQQKCNFDRVAYLPPLQTIPPGTALRSSERFESRHPVMKEIMRALALTDSKVSKIGVYGLGGVGKTTLMEGVAAKAKDDKLFDAVVMAFVTKSPDIRRIQDEIADQLGLQFNENSLFGRARRLHDRIEREKSILIILDDLCTRLDLVAVGIPVGDAQENLKREMESITVRKIHPGCKLLLTSRSLDVLQEMETEEDFRLEVLNESETWSLFQDKVGDVVKDTSLRNIAIEVAKKCAGLPVLIVTVARALRNKGIYDWKEAIKKLERVDNMEMQEITYSALEFCYNWLESDEVKAFFLLCGVMGPTVNVEYLLKCVKGLSIFKHITTMQDARSRLYKMIVALQASCLLLEGDTTVEVKMHDIVHEVAISIASRDQHVYIVKEDTKSIEWPTENFLKRCSMILLKWCRIHKLPERLNCPEINLFCLESGDRSLQIPTSFFEGMEKLKVLDLTSMNLSSLPTSFRSLTNLQTLCFYDCALEDITSIGALKNLEILSLYGSSMTKFPSEIVQLTHLRMLELSNSGIEVIPPNIISNLTRLEELYMGNTSIKWEPENSANQHKNASLAELRQLPNLTALDIQIREAWILPRDLMFEKLERYKIFIGDVWEWSGKYETSKTLKLKLHTSIHLEHGIKLLIRRVEDLYLDELNGISNVLFQLNGEGFPHLKHLHIQNNAEIKHIINSEEWAQSQDSFPKLETLVLQNLDNLEKISHGALMVNSFGNLKIIKVKSCDRLRYLLLSSIADGLSQLMEIEVSECKSMKTIVLVESDTNVDRGIIEFYQLRSLTLQSLLMLDDFYFHELESSTTMRKCKQSVTYIPTPLFSKKVAFPNLETLKLSAINLKKIWDDDQVSAITSIQNLTHLIVEDCGALKYLFSSFRIATFPKLKWLEISKCHMMEEIIVTEEEANNNVFTEVGLPKLEKIIIKDMQNLKTIWHPQLTASSFGKLKTLEVESCPKLVNIFPSYMQRKFSNLETLTVSDCDSMEEIFQLDANETCSEEDTTELKSMTLLRLPKLKQIWSKEPQGILRFHNLQAISVEICYNLVYLFPFSVAANLLQLEELLLNECGITYIVAKKEGPMEGTAIFVLNRLTSLTLQNLSKLKGFYSGIHTLACSSLKALNVFNCNKLKLFKTLSTRQRRSPDDTAYEQPLFTVEEVIPNLEELALNNEDSNMILEGQFLGHLFSRLKFLRVCKFENEEATFPYWFLQNIPTLESILVQSSSFKEIFRDEKLGGGEGQIESSTQLKWLTLAYLPKFQHICEEGSKIDPVLEVLETLFVLNCSGLKNLFPSSVTLSHLTYLEITNCNGLINITTCSTMRSLVKLRTMKIKDCNSLEEIVSEKEDETKEEIIFGALEILELICLPKLNRFCSSKCLLRFQLLETVVVRQCPRMNTFCKGSTSAVKLRKVQIEESDDGWYWEGDLNGTISKMFAKKVAFHSFKHLELFEYPELKELWYGSYGQGGHQIFSNLKSLGVKKCDFLADTLFPSNLIRVLQHLEELEVRDCDLLEAVFEIEVIDDKEMQVREITQLKNLTLSGLPRLKHVWRKDPKGTLSFQNLCIVNVADCESLESLFQPSIAKELLKLEELEVVSCGIEEIVAKEEGLVEIIEFVFPRISSLKFLWLSNLKSLYPGKHTSEWPSLKKVDIYECNKLGIFAPGLPILLETKEEDGLAVQRQQPLFFLEKVIPNLVELTLNNEDTNMILQGQFSGHLFSKLKSLNLSKFENEEATFPYWFLQNIPTLETIVVEFSSFKEIFRDEKRGGGEGQIASSTQLKKLTLSNLPELQHICEEGSKIDPVLEVLETLFVLNCSGLTNLFPSSVTLSHLTYLEITNCNGLINITTCSAMRSLVKLRTMKIKECNSVEEIVSEKGDEAKQEIIFGALEILELVCLPKLNRFCSSKCLLRFQLLETVIVSQCPRMNTFSKGSTSALKLRKVQIEESDVGWCWEGDLNGTINKMFAEKVAFQNFEHLRLVEYPELKELWYGKLPHKIFRSLKSLVVQKCDFLADTLFPSNLIRVLQHLEELEVRDCDLLEAVFEIEVIDDKEMQVREITQLKNLTLSGLPRLKHVWRKDPKGTLSFQNLCIVNVADCESLESLFQPSIAKELLKLEELEVVSCGIEEIVAKEEGLVEIIEFVFPRISSLKFLWLSNLKSLYPGKHTSEWPSLKKVDIYECNKLGIFAPGLPILLETKEEDGLAVQRQQPLFFLEKVIPNLVELTLNNEDTNMILQGQFSGHLFSKLKSLNLSKFENEEATFPYWFLQNIPTLETIVVEFSSFKEIFRDEKRGGGEGQIASSTQLKKLTLSNLPELQHICEEGSKIDPVLEVLETLFVLNCSGLTNLFPSSVTLSHLTYLEITNCNGLINITTCSAMRSLVKLRTMKIKECNSVEEIVSEKGDEAKQEIIFGALEILELVCLPKLNRFCSSKCLLRFQLLETVIVSQCPRMNTFSKGSTSALKLRKVQIEESDVGWCWEGDLNGTINKMFAEKVAFQNFEHLRLVEYPELKELWYGKLPHKIFRSLKSLVVQKCDFLADTLFPSNLIRVLQHLEELEVRDCDLLEAVFEIEVIDDKEMQVREITQLKNLTLSGLPRLKHVWRKDPKGTLSFQNLCIVNVADCESLESLFQPSIAKELLKLEELEVVSCGIEEIVAKEEGLVEIIEFVFPRISSLKFLWLSNLKSLYPGKHTSEWPSLKKVDIYECNKLGIFAPGLPILLETKEEDGLAVQRQQPLFFLEKVIPNLVELTLNNEDTNMILQGQFSGHLFSKLKSLNLSKFENEEATFPYWFLQNIPTLETIVVEFSSFKEIFRDEKRGGGEGQIASSTQLKKLTLSNLPELQHICEEGSKIDPVLEVLETLFVLNCSGLTNLFPSSVTLSHLTYLEITNCNGLINITTCSAMRSLVKLRTMKIKECNSVEEIVSEKGDEAKQEIIFGALEILELVCLPKLNRFCSSKCLLRFQLLETVIVSQCPRMNTFSKGSTSALKLRKVQIEESDVGWCWEGDLNGTINKMFAEKVAFHGFKHLELFEYPELKELWYGLYGQGGHQIFSNVKSLRVKKCDFLSDVLFPSNLLQVLHNLEELEVTDCASLEALIDVKGTNGKEMQMKETSQLKRLKLSGLPNLKHIWNKDHHGIISFRNLLMVHAVNCENLKNLFPVSLSKDLVQLQELDIETCGLVEIFAKEEGLEECSFDFPQLTKLRLWSLTKLKCFYPGRHILDCPSLMNLNVYHCGALQTFSFDHSGFQQAYGMGEVDFPIPQALFPLQKVCPKLELLALNSEDVLTLRSGHYQENLFHKIDDLRLQCFHETQAVVPIDFLQRFPNLVTLVLRCSSFETLFPLEGVGHQNTGAPLQIRELILYKLEQLKYIWCEDSQSIGLVETLDSLPSSISFKNLTFLYVEDCKRLMYLITSSIAKSLLQLTSIKIINCERIEDAVKNDEETEEIITFQNLEYLELTSLSNLRSFCSGKQTFILPSLVDLVVTGCPKMKTFSSGVVIAPMLQSVAIENENKHWKDDLNTTIQQLFKGKETLNFLCEVRL